MRRILALTLLAALGLWGGTSLGRLLASDEDRIRWAFMEGVDGFNAGRPGTAVSPLAEDWYCRSTGVHRDTLHQALVGMAFQERGRAGGRTGWHLALPRELLRIDVRDDDTARARFELSLSRRRGEELDPVWRLAVDAELREEGGGWKVWKSAYDTVEGRRP